MKNIIAIAFRNSKEWNLTEYHRMFIDSLERYYRKFKRLTPAQSKVLMSIWDQQEAMNLPCKQEANDKQQTETQ